MATKKYLDETGLADVAGHVNSRLKTVSTMPVTADLNAVRLYTGEDTQTYKKGHIYQMAATEQNFLQFSADTTTYFMSEDGTITSSAPTSYSPQVENVPFTDESTGATLVYMAGNNALVQKLENDVNVITVNFNKIKTSVMPWWTAGAATGSYNPFTIRNVQLVAVTAWVDITSGGGIKTVTVMPENPTDKDVVIYIGESGMVYEQNHIYQYDLAEDEWIDITAVVPDEEAREVAAGAMALAEEAFETSTKIWKGSEADWDLLPISEKIKYDYVAFDEEDDPITAATLPYDNTESGLVSTNVQGAIDETLDIVKTKSAGFVIVAQDGSGDFTTINAAVDSIPDGGDVKIYLKSGNYNEVINCATRFNSVTIIGENKYNCRIYNETGVYKNSPLIINGNFVLRNLFFEMNLNNVGSWTPTYTEDTANTYPGYACHIDGQSYDSNSPARAEIHNCIFRSEAFPAVGMGVNNKQYVEFRDCEFYRLTTDANYKRDNWRGALLCHCSNTATDTGCNLMLFNNVFFTVYGYAAHIRCADLAGQGGFYLTAIDNKFISTQAYTPGSDGPYVGRCYYTKGNSNLRLGYGNTDPDLNIQADALLTTEHKPTFAGYYWANGEPVYRALIYHGSTAGGLLQIDVSEYKIAAPVKITGAGYDGTTYWYPISYGEQGDSHLSYSAFYNATVDKLFIRTQGIAVESGNVVIEYLKRSE